MNLYEKILKRADDQNKSRPLPVCLIVCVFVCLKATGRVFFSRFGEEMMLVVSFSALRSPSASSLPPNFVAYFLAALKNCLWRGGRGGGAGREWGAEEASEGLPLYLLAQTSIMADSPPPSPTATAAL